VHIIFTGKSESKIQHVIPRFKWKNIKMYLIRIGFQDVDSSGSGQGLVLDSCEHGNKSLGPIKNEKFF
jgi:hypothetical protein